MKQGAINRYVAILSINVIGYCLLNDTGLYFGCSLWERLTYPLGHANIFHLLANMWCSFVIVKSNFRESILTWMLAYIIAVTSPAGAAVTVGFSGVLYAVMGIISWQAQKFWNFHAWTLGFMFLMFLIPGKVNNCVHVYCYAMGILAGSLINYYGDKRTTY